MTDFPTKRLKRLSPADLADEAFVAKAWIDAIKREAVRRGLKTAEGEVGRFSLSPPSTQERSDRTALLQALDISEADFISRFCRQVKVDWRLTISSRKTFAAPAA